MTDAKCELFAQLNSDIDRFDLFSHILTKIIWNKFHVHQDNAL